MPTEAEINELFKDVDSLRYEVRRTFRLPLPKGFIARSTFIYGPGVRE
jgi:hypothetical protein